MSKLIIITAPSGAGKTTIVHHLLNKYDELAFSVSATTRAKRKNEKEGIDYYFLSLEEFKRKLDRGDFVEWEEVYEGQFYGTLKSEIQRLWKAGMRIVFDVEVKGASNLKGFYKNEATAIFVKPPSFQVLAQRLKNRKTETQESLQKRLARVKEELKYENNFDIILVNDILEVTLKEAELIVEDLIYA